MHLRLTRLPLQVIMQMHRLRHRLHPPPVSHAGTIILRRIEHTLIRHLHTIVITLIPNQKAKHPPTRPRQHQISETQGLQIKS